MKKIYSIFPILSGICFGSLGIFVRDLSKTMNSTTIISSRIIFAAIILGIWIACFHAEYFKIKLKDIWICVCSGIIGTLGLNICYNFAINELTLSLSAVLLSLSPIFVMIFAFFLFGESITAKKIISVIMAIIGCVLTSGVLESNSGLKWSGIGILIGGAGAFFYALYSIFSKIGIKRGYPAITITFYSMTVIAIVLLPFTEWSHIFKFIAVSPVTNVPFMIIHSLCAAVFPYVFYTVSLNHMDAGKASILCSCEPVAAMVFGVIFFDEMPTVLSIIGLIIVLVALAMLVLQGKENVEKN